MNRREIESKDQLVRLLRDMIEDQDGLGFENGTTSQYLEALAAWLDDCEGYYKNIGEQRAANNADWQLFADAIQAATIYE